MGDIEDNGRFPGLMKLAGAGGGTFKSLLDFAGTVKSSIWMFRTIPVLGDSITAPKQLFTEVAIETAFLSRSMIDKWLVP